MTLTAEPVRQLTVKTETLFRGVLGLMLGVGSISFFEPSPYEFVFFILAPMVAFGHFVITRVTLLLFLFVAIFLFAETLALVPYFSHRPVLDDSGSGSSPVIFTLETIYLYSSVLMFSVIFSKHTSARLKVALVAYTISGIFAASWGVAGHFGWFGIKDSASIVGRIAGPFKDPNVLGAYSILGVLYLMQSIISASSRLWFLNIITLAVMLFGGIFLPLSRGAWGAMAFAALYFGIVTFYTADNRNTRRKIIFGVVGLAIILGVAGFFIARDPTLSGSVVNRAKVEQDYDGGVTGRFGNQKRSIPMLLERPFGFGPHRFALTFDLDPHNSYIGAFASAGWLGGLTFVLLVGVTSFIALRLTVLPSPWLRHAQVITPALLSAFMQAIQIDIDHWRFIYLMIGAIWGMEAARHQALFLDVRRNARLCRRIIRCPVLKIAGAFDLAHRCNKLTCCIATGLLGFLRKRR